MICLFSATFIRFPNTSSKSLSASFRPVRLSLLSHLHSLYCIPIQLLHEILQHLLHHLSYYLLSKLIIVGSRESSVGRSAGRQRSRERQNVSLWGPPWFKINGYRTSFPGDKAAGTWDWPLGSVPRLRMCWVLPLLSYAPSWSGV